jgi:hypothetical protein
MAMPKISRPRNIMFLGFFFAFFCLRKPQSNISINELDRSQVRAQFGITRSHMEKASLEFLIVISEAETPTLGEPRMV